MAISSTGLGPQRVDGTTMFTRLFFGLLGGITGFLLILLAFLVSTRLTTNFFADDVIFTGVANFAILTSLFLSATVTNLVATWLLSIAQQVKYTRITEGLMQVLTVNIILFIFTACAFFLADRSNHALTLGLIVFHFVFTAMSSALVFEITATRWAYPLVTVYDTLLGTFVAGVFLLVLFQSTGSYVTFLFGVPVVVWTVLGFISGLTEYIYFQSYTRLGIDFLQSRQVAAHEEPLEEQFDESDDTKPF